MFSTFPSLDKDIRKVIETIDNKRGKRGIYRYIHNIAPPVSITLLIVMLGIDVALPDNLLLNIQAVAE